MAKPFKKTKQHKPKPLKELTSEKSVKSSLVAIPQDSANSTAESEYPFLIQSLLQATSTQLDKDSRDGEQAFKTMGGFPDSIIAQVLLTIAKERVELALPLLAEAVNHPSPLVLSAAIQALSLIRLPEAAFILNQLEAETEWDDQKAAIRKELSRSLHRFKSMGIIPSSPEAETIVTTDNPARLEANPTISSERQFQQALVSNLDGVGNILGILVMRSPGGKYETAVLLFNETDGLKDCKVYSFNQRRLEGFLQEWDLETTGVGLVPVERDYLDYLVNEHLQLNRAHNLPVAPDFVAWRRYFNLSENLSGDLSEADRQPHPVYEKISLDSLRDSLAYLLPRSESLIQTPEMKNWLLEPAMINEYAQKLLERRQSRIMVGGSFLQEYKYKLALEAGEHLFTKEFIQRYSRRLEHMALVFFLTGQTNHARLALAASLDLEEGKKPNQNPVLWALTLSSLETMTDLLATNDQPENQKADSLRIR